MIIVNLKGGLGNQMFQYACGRALSLQAKAHSEDRTLKLDAGGYDRLKGIETARSYKLGAFNIGATLADAQEVRRLKYPFGPFSKAARLFRAKILRQYYTAFVPKVLTWKGDIYLDGYFQSEKYFKDVEGQIRKDFTLRKPMSPAGENAARLVARDSFAVSLHIRRGDYVSDAGTNAHHGSCDLAYYEKAVAQMPAASTFYVFSDDIEWAKENLKLGRPTVFVSKPDIKDVEEMVVMSRCRHNIVANSSFSWWAAWLNPHSDKIVIAPATWARKNDKTWYKDIVPSSWIRI